MSAGWVFAIACGAVIAGFVFLIGYIVVSTWQRDRKAQIKRNGGKR